MLGVMNIFGTVFGILEKIAPAIFGYLFRRSQDKAATAEKKIEVMEKHNETLVQMDVAQRSYNSDGVTKRLRDGKF